MGRRNLLLAVQDHPYIYVVVGEISRSIIICWEFEIWNIQYSEKLMVSGKMYSVQYHTVALSYRYHKYYIYSNSMILIATAVSTARLTAVRSSV